MVWYGKGIDGKDYIGQLQTVGLKRYIKDFRGLHEVIPASVKIVR
jgi:hypothetical protein